MATLSQGLMTRICSLGTMMFLAGCQNDPETTTTASTSRQSTSTTIQQGQQVQQSDGQVNAVQGTSNPIRIPSEAKFLGSCQGNMRIFDARGNLSSNGQKAFQLLTTLIINKKTFKCKEYHQQTIPESIGSALQDKIETANRFCLNDSSFATATFSTDKRCSPPTLGFQELFSITANFDSETMNEHDLSTVNFLGLSNQEISTLKAGIMEIYGSETGQIPRRYTSQLK